MDFDAWHHWMLLRPLFVFLLAGPFVVLAALVGWYAERRRERRAIRAEENKLVRVPAVIQDAASQVDQVAACEELVSQHVEEWLSAREWDGEQPRPNWNRRSG
jgi:hypothetical protein